MWVVRAILIVAILILMVGFMFNNYGPDQTVDVHLRPVLNDYADVPLLTVVFWSFVAGVVVSLLLFITMYVKQTVDGHAARKRIRALESEVAILRNRPIEESVDLLRGADNRFNDLKSPFLE